MNTNFYTLNSIANQVQNDRQHEAQNERLWKKALRACSKNAK
jgi:hypothetical protein